MHKAILYRVIRESTLILEERLRSAVPYDKICELIPMSKDQIGENLRQQTTVIH